MSRRDMSFHRIAADKGYRLVLRIFMNHFLGSGRANTLLVICSEQPTESSDVLRRTRYQGILKRANSMRVIDDGLASQELSDRLKFVP